MSKEDAKKFIKKINSDSSLREKIMGAEDLSERMKIIAQEGFEVTKEEIELATEDFKTQDPELRRKEGLAGDLTDILDILKYVIRPF
jgi:predicted ribosomally synthesized peptide with nif11-like leader